MEPVATQHPSGNAVKRTSPLPTVDTEDPEYIQWLLCTGITDAVRTALVRTLKLRSKQSTNDTTSKSFAHASLAFNLNTTEGRTTANELMRHIKPALIDAGVSLPGIAVNTKPTGSTKSTTGKPEPKSENQPSAKRQKNSTGTKGSKAE